jgi:hypothetical protein
MAKVTGPLFSITASGQIAKSLVYMKWKGIADVRKYVIPANPNTILQHTQRDYFADGVSIWHSNPWNASDLTAWNAMAAMAATVRSGFNQWMEKYISVRVAGKTFRGTYTQSNVPAATTCAVTFFSNIDEGKFATIKYGTSKTALNLSLDADVGALGSLVFNLTSLVASTVYYFKVIPKDTTQYTYTGIYTFETLAA